MRLIEHVLEVDWLVLVSLDCAEVIVC